MLTTERGALARAIARNVPRLRIDVTSPVVPKPPRAPLTSTDSPGLDARCAAARRPR
jgi:hypothetical protein